MPNIVLGAGKLFFQPEDANGNLTDGEIYLAETPGITIPITTQRVEVFSSDTATEERIVDIPRRIERNFRFSTRDINGDSLPLFLIGASATVTQTATPVVGEAIGKLKKGTYLQLGTSLNPAGIRGCSSVAIKNGATPLVLNTDYTLDAALGRIYILPGTAVAEGTALTADFTPTANTREQVATSGTAAKTGALRYIADNTAGVNRDVYIPKVTLTPDGEWALKSRENPQELGFDARIGLRASLAAMYVDGRPV